MDTLNYKCFTTEVTDITDRTEFTPSFISQTDQYGSDLVGVVESTLTPDTTDSSDCILTIDDILSPSFVPAEGQQWFYMHAAFGNNRNAVEAFRKAGIFAYIPEETVLVQNIDGTKTPRRKLVFASYLFVLATYDQIKGFTSRGGTKFSLPYLHFVYDKSNKNESGKFTCVTIRHKAMVNLLRLAQFNTYKVHAVDPSKVRFVSDEPVRVTSGVFKDTVGRVARIHNQTTVVVTIPGVVSMTTPYISKHFMEPYVKEEKMKPTI